MIIEDLIRTHKWACTTLFTEKTWMKAFIKLDAGSSKPSLILPFNYEFVVLQLAQLKFYQGSILALRIFLMKKLD